MLDDLLARGLAKPELVIVDGTDAAAKRLMRAKAELKALTIEQPT